MLAPRNTEQRDFKRGLGRVNEPQDVGFPGSSRRDHFKPQEIAVEAERSFEIGHRYSGVIDGKHGRLGFASRRRHCPLSPPAGERWPRHESTSQPNQHSTARRVGKAQRREHDDDGGHASPFAKWQA